MKLKEFMAILEPDTNCFIGAVGGSNFMFAAKQSQFDEDVAKINAENISRAETAINSAMASKEQLTNQLKEITKTLDRKDKDEKYKVKHTEFLMDSVMRKYKRVGSQLQSVKYYKEYIKHYIPIEEREVCDSFPRISDEGVVIMIPGIENSMFWFAEEYATGKVDRSDDVGGEE